MSEFKIAVCQMDILEKKEDNLIKVEGMLKEASHNGANLVVLPEMFNCPYNNSFFPKYAEEFPGITTNFLSRLAKDENIYIVGGSIPEKEGQKIYNTSYVFDRDGKLIGKHRKIHLFDIDIEDEITFKESETLGYGNTVTVIETEFCKIGVAICYDMRFPELMRLMAIKGAEVIVVPAAFNMTTGPAHWHSIAKIRALDNQVYFVAASPSRNIDSTYVAFGHSLIVDPWGEIISEADEKETIIYGEIDLNRIKKIRNQLPLLKHRRTDLYDIKELSIH
ncbi:carbon-nitrogen hydrolase family protein [Paramaledivibacter caminithermalis]|jgi:predicted amidohydrolase|uniref:Predicted amidohydrolase n=1 Tax=Paramaledivibacter caminithermalis (strain DSM 15212 / CIP 107654 / DViRD3) TaxID=1121301 RepID=A0A1M6ST68_PARC5|nr:carbon-nitrogen hydrolase family protein [Paramaledivibacter caminithermalis]SHK47837.1 Predicted amidohydrolase [Paramaledivibacter caminithermalis DSM 15212]